MPLVWGYFVCVGVYRGAFGAGHNAPKYYAPGPNARTNNTNADKMPLSGGILSRLAFFVGAFGSGHNVRGAFRPFPKIHVYLNSNRRREARI